MFKTNCTAGARATPAPAFARVLRRLVLGVSALLLFGGANAARAQAQCPSASSSTFTFTPQALGDSVTVTIALAPCETISVVESHDQMGDANRGTNVKITYLNSVGQTIRTETKWGFFSGTNNFPAATPWPFPWRGSRSANVLPHTLKVESVDGYGRGNPPIAPSYNFTVTRSPRPGYNVGGDSFGNALLISSFPVSYKGSVYQDNNTPADLGQYFKINLSGNQQMFVSGTAEGSTNYGAIYRVDVHAANQQLLTTNGWVTVGAYGVKTYSSSAFTNPNSTAADFYIRVRSTLWPIYDFVLNVLPVRADLASLSSVAKDGTASVAVTVTPTSNQIPITLSLRTLSGTGEARFADDSTTMTITQSTTVQIKGITESSAEDNIRLESKVNDLLSDAEDFSVVKVDKLQYQSGSNYVDITAPLYVLKGGSVTFKALPKPTGAAWPSGKPVWSGTAGASGTGATKTVTFNLASADVTDYKTVVADCGGTVTANVIVYELSGVLTPQDNFSGRSATSYGLSEKVDLSFTATPAITAAEAGGLKWVIVSGGGTFDLVNATNGINTYNAPKTAGAVTLKLEVIAGPSKGLGPTFNRAVVAPSGAYMALASDNQTIRHCYGFSSVGFYGEVFLLPKDVSFARLYFREGGGTATATGFYVSQNMVAHQPTGFMSAVTNCNIALGCKAFYDQVWTNTWPSPFTPGTFNWPIEWLFAFANDLDPAFNGQTLFTIANHYQTSDANGTATIEKASAGPYSKAANDPDVDCW